MEGGWAERYWNEADDLWPQHPPNSPPARMQAQHQRFCAGRREIGRDWEEEV
ncbi:hypothetical protein [Brevundimonas sp.]|uniref:hypothetical protein n=1 Tax=Brevundimonas sp. TaxID=1871086 RepID=UPI002737B022|nr:hypothetical protein [Brevundimonas sp.]MDP3801412.1 hypothetical protein [Brevundimonas sp.]